MVLYKRIVARMQQAQTTSLFAPYCIQHNFLYLQLLLLGGSIASLRYSLVLFILYLYNREKHFIKMCIYTKI